MLIKKLNAILIASSIMVLNQGCITTNQHSMDKYGDEKKQQKNFLSKELEKEKERSYKLDIEEKKLSDGSPFERGSKIYENRLLNTFESTVLEKEHRKKLREKEKEEMFDRHCKRNEWRQDKIKNKNKK